MGKKRGNIVMNTFNSMGVYSKIFAFAVSAFFLLVGYYVLVGTGDDKNKKDKLADTGLVGKVTDSAKSLAKPVNDALFNNKAEESKGNLVIQWGKWLWSYKIVRWPIIVCSAILVLWCLSGCYSYFNKPVVTRLDN